MHAFDAGRVAPEAVDGRGVDLAVQARQLVDERVVPVVRPIIRLARRAVELDRVVSLEARPLRLVGAIAEGQQLASPVRKSTSESSALRKVISPGAVEQASRRWRREAAARKFDSCTATRSKA